MKTFGWLVASGVLWLLLVKWAQTLGVAPQWISISRTIYIGTSSIFLLLELRRAHYETGQRPEEPFGIPLRELAWYTIPAFSTIPLAFLSSELKLEASAIAWLFSFWCLQLIVLVWRQSRNGIRSGLWDLIPPLILLAILLMPLRPWLAVLAGLVALAAATRTRGTIGEGPADSLIIQLPSLCLAPAALIVLRDSISQSALFDRSNMEALGMVVNGVGAALWTSIVMRTTRLVPLSAGLWIGGALAALVATLDLHSLWRVIPALLAAELLRGSLWLATTATMARSGRWQGFTVNLFATCIPLLAVALAPFVQARVVILLYAALHFLAPLGSWWLVKHRCPSNATT